MKLTALLPAALPLLLLAGCSKDKEQETQPIVPVQVTELRTAPIQRIIEADGILRALEQSAVTPKIAAPVAKFYVNRGDRVKPGQLLALLENRDLKAAVADAKGAYEQAASNYRNVSSASVPDEVVKAQADVQSAKPQFDAARKLLESREQLYKEGALARRQVDEATVAYAQAKSQYDTAQRHLESVHRVSRHEEVKSAAAQGDSAQGRYDAARAQLSYSEIRSPIAGVVADRSLFPGEMAVPGTPLLTIVNATNVIARVNLPQAQAAFVKVGQKASIMATTNSAEINGKVTVVSPAVDAQSTTVEVWVQVVNPGETLRPGGTAHVKIFGETIPGAVVVAAQALLPSDDGGSVLMAVDAGNVAHRRKVEVGIRTSDTVQIVSGAEPGLKVVSSGGVGLDDGAKVRIEPAGPETAKEAAAHE